MNTTGRKRFLGLVALSAGLLMVGTASAWYASPWYRPYGAGAMTYERQNMMRGHAYAMQGLSGMLEGRRAFDRDEAVRLARELEQGFGDDLVSKYAPGAVVAGSRTVPWTWDNFGTFQGYANAAGQSSARLAKALEKEPAEPAVGQRGGMIAPRPIGYGPWGHRRGNPVSMEVIQEYSRLNATCHSCHMLFRGGRW